MLAKDGKRRLSELSLDPKNARRHSARQVDQIVESIRRFGFVEKLICRPTGHLIGGEGRLLALRKLHPDDDPEIEVRIVELGSDAEYIALGLALNKLGELSEFDDAALAIALADIKAAGADTAGLGFSNAEVDRMFGPAPAWPAARVRMRSIAELVPYAQNARTHTIAQIDQIVISIKQFGMTNAILVEPDGGIVAGHGRVMALQKMGETEVPVMVAKGWSAEQKAAYVIADNKLAENAGWDRELLKAEFGMLRAGGWDVELTGFSKAEIQDIDLGPQLHAKLSDRFGTPPFTVLSARDGWWQDRKNAWLALGIQSEIGRGEDTLGFSDTVKSKVKIGTEGRAAAMAVPGHGMGRAPALYKDRKVYDRKNAWEAATGRKIGLTEFVNMEAEQPDGKAGERAQS